VHLWAIRHNEAALWELARAAFKNLSTPLAQEVLIARDGAVVSQLFSSPRLLH
jgi:hypothetical protein